MNIMCCRRTSEILRENWSRANRASGIIEMFVIRLMVGWDDDDLHEGDGDDDGYFSKEKKQQAIHSKVYLLSVWRVYITKCWCFDHLTKHYQDWYRSQIIASIHDPVPYQWLRSQYSVYDSVFGPQEKYLVFRFPIQPSFCRQLPMPLP